MFDNGLNCFPSPYGSTPMLGWNQWQSSGQQNIPPNYYNSPYQQQQQQQIPNKHTSVTTPSLFKLYDFEGNKQSEIIRLIFYYAGISFKDKRVKQDEWERVKERIPIQQLPILRVNNQFKIYYLNTIVRYLAREFRLYGKDNNDHAMVDIIVEFNQEFQKKFFEKIDNIIDIEERKKVSTEFFDNNGINYLKQLEDFYKIFNQQGPFYLGNQISLADLIVYQTINYFIDINSKLLDNYSHLQQAYHHLSKQPQLINYYNNKTLTINKKRHKSVPQRTNNNNRQHRHRSHDANKSSHRRPSKESIFSLQTTQLKEKELITPSQATQSKERELITPPQTTRPKENEVILPSQAAQSKEKEITDSLPTKQELEPLNTESHPPLETKQESDENKSTQVKPPSSSPVVAEEKSEHINF